MRAVDVGRSGSPKNRYCTPAPVSSMRPSLGGRKLDKLSWRKIRQNIRRNISWRQGLVLLLTLLLLLWVARSVSPREALATLVQLSRSDLLLLAGVNLLVLSTFGGRWWLLLRAQGQQLPYWRLLGYRITAFAISYFTPGSHFGGEPYQIYATTRWHGTPTPISI